MFTLGHMYAAFIPLPGELTNMGFGMILMGMLYFATYSAVMKECDAPESNKTEAGAELTRKYQSPHLELPERSQLSRGSPSHVHSSATLYWPADSGSHCDAAVAAADSASDHCY